MTQEKNNIKSDPKKIKLNNCGKEWKPMGCPYKQALLQEDQTWYQKWLDLVTAAIDVFEPDGRIPGRTTEEKDAYHDAFYEILLTKVFFEFDPKASKKMELYNYMSSRIQWKKIDILRKQYGRKIEDNSEQDSQTTSCKRREFTSLNIEIGDDGQSELLDLQSNDESQYEIMEKLWEIIEEMEMLGQAISLKVSLSGDKKNAQILPVIYTSEVINREHFDNQKLFLGQHSLDINRALNNDFVDRCMCNQCRGVEEIYYGALRKYGDVIEDTGRYAPDECIPLPMEDKVGRIFLNIPKGTYSKAKGEFYELVKEIKGW